MFGFNHLCVININARVLPTALEMWNAHNVIMVDTCMRKTFIGQEADFATFPLQEVPAEKCQRLTEGDAYGFLLSLKSGLESGKVGETNIDGQLIRDVEQFGQRCPDKLGNMTRLLDMLKSDARYIRTQYVDHLEKGTIENSAKILSEFERGDDVVIIGKIGRKQIVSPITTDLAYAVASARQIFFSGAEPETVERLSVHFAQADIRKRISSKTLLNYVPFGAVPDIINDGCHVFIDQPMGDSAWNDSLLMNAWKKSAKEDFGMVHLRGSPALMGGSTKTWKNAELANYFGPEDVRLRKVRLDRENEAIIAKAKQDIALIAGARQDGFTHSQHRIINGFKPRVAAITNDSMMQLSVA